MGQPKISRTKDLQKIMFTNQQSETSPTFLLRCRMSFPLGFYRVLCFIHIRPWLSTHLICPRILEIPCQERQPVDKFPGFGVEVASCDDGVASLRCELDEAAQLKRLYSFVHLRVGLACSSLCGLIINYSKNYFLIKRSQISHVNMLLLKRNVHSTH